jgi:hypothetical protein
MRYSGRQFFKTLQDVETLSKSCPFGEAISLNMSPNAQTKEIINIHLKNK